MKFKNMSDEQLKLEVARLKEALKDAKMELLCRDWEVRRQKYPTWDSWPISERKAHRRFTRKLKAISDAAYRKRVAERKAEK